MKQLKDDPEYQKPIAGEDMLEPLCADLEVGLEALVAYGQGPPSDLTAQDIKDECEQASRLAIEAWCNRLIWSKAVVPSANAPALLETENLPVIRPEDILRPLSLGQLYDLVDEWDRQPWVWDGILPHSSLSLIVGKSETGKSTLTYALLYAIVKGLTFFGRQCEQGRVLYLAGDPMSEVVAGKTFKGLGLDRDDGVMVLPGALAANPSGMRQLRDIVQSFKPAIVVGDTLAATVEIDTEKYGQSQKAQHPLVKIARDLGPNFLMSHHSQKSAIDSYSVIDSALGTVGVAAVASSRMGTKMYRRGKERFYTFEMSNLRIGQPIEGEWIVKKYDNGLMELDGLWAGRAAVLDTEAIVKALEEHGDDWIAGRTLWQETSPKPKYGVFMQALRGLVKEKAVETDKRPGKGGGYLYRKALNQPAPQPDFYKDS